MPENTGLDMDFEFYPYSCVIRRSKGVDERSEEIFDIIYEGKCSLQPSNSGSISESGGMLGSKPNFFIPPADVELKRNDSVVVTSPAGRVSEYTINDFFVVSDPVLACTAVWLKETSHHG